MTTVSALQLGSEANTNHFHKVSQVRDSQSCPEDKPAALSRPRDGSAVKGSFMLLFHTNKGHHLQKYYCLKTELPCRPHKREQPRSEVLLLNKGKDQGGCGRKQDCQAVRNLKVKAAGSSIRTGEYISKDRPTQGG